MPSTRTGKRPGRKWVLVLLFLATLPISFFVGLTFVLGHGRVVPYLSVWVDRVAFAAVVLGLPSLVAVAAHGIMGMRR